MGDMLKVTYVNPEGRKYEVVHVKCGGVPRFVEIITAVGEVFHVYDRDVMVECGDGKVVPWCEVGM